MITKKRQLFIDEYIRTLNGTQSAIQAGFSAKIAYSYASELLRKPEVKEAIDKGLALKCKESKLTKTSLLTKLSDIINNPDSKHSDVTRAIEVASKILRLYKDNAGTQVSLFQRIQQDIERDDDVPYIPERQGYVEGEDNEQGK